MVEKAKDVVIRRSSFIKEGETIENDYEFVGKVYICLYKHILIYIYIYIYI